LPGTDGWVSLHVADTAALTLPDIVDLELGEQHAKVLDVLAGGGGYFFRQLSDAVGSTDDQALSAVIWDLAWAGHLTNDTLAPMRVQLSGRGTHRPRRSPPRGRIGSVRRSGVGRGLSRAAMPSRTGPPTVGGRWSLTPDRESDPTRRAHAAAEALLERHGVVTRGAFVAGLGAAQFGLTGAVDRLRSLAQQAEQGRADGAPRALVLAATDPANPYGAALPWPDRVTDAANTGHRPGRKAGAVVCVVDGSLALYVERGGRTLLTFSQDPERIQPAVDALALAVREGALGRLTVERADGEHILGSPLAAALEAAGFHATPRGLRLRA
jgi:ATP-dependent Lhr-like helicase